MKALESDFITLDLSQAIENVFAIGNKIPLGSCFCQPPGGMVNNTAERFEEYMTYDKESCKVSRC